MREKLKALWDRIYVCGTIFLQRVQVLAGIVWGVAIVTDLSAFFTNPKWLTAYMIANGVASEITRRYKTKDKLEL